MRKQQEAIIKRRVSEQTQDYRVEDFWSADYLFKVIIIGDPGVGRRSLLLNIGDLDSAGMPVVGVSFLKKNVRLDENSIVSLMYWNIASQPQFYMLHHPYFNGANGIIFVYDVTCSSTFSNINKWYNSCVKNGLSELPRILIGNKADLVDKKKIILPMAEYLSDKIDAPLFETSALTGHNVNEAFHKITELIWNARPVG
jgi:Ras-related protein Rab-1A